MRSTSTFPPQTKFFNQRRIPLLIIHGTAVDDKTAEAIFLGKTAYEASVHYYIKHNGACEQYLDESVRAYHAGLSRWAGFDDLNAVSIGIELECLSKNASFSNPKESFYTKAQMQALIALSKNIIIRHHIKPWNILAHQDVSADRRHLLPPEVLNQQHAYVDVTGKLDPGPFFNWHLLAKEGIGLWHNQKPYGKDALLNQEAEKAFLNRLFLYGYDPRVIGPDGHGPEKIIAAFHTHFMPWLFGTPLFGKPTKQSLEIAEILWAEKLK